MRRPSESYLNVTALNNSSNNPGTVAEAFVEGPSTTLSAFNSDATTRVGTVATGVSTAAAVEPCGTPNVNLNASCVFDGNINFVF